MPITVEKLLIASLCVVVLALSAAVAIAVIVVGASWNWVHGVGGSGDISGANTVLQIIVVFIALGTGIIAIYTALLVRDQVALQTAISIMARVQNEGVRKSRQRLFARPEWDKTDVDDPTTQDADNVRQAFNAAGYFIMHNPGLQKVLLEYIEGTRRGIVMSHFYTKKWIDHRRTLQKDLRKESDWLAKTAAHLVSPGEPSQWGIADHMNALWQAYDELPNSENTALRFAACTPGGLGRPQIDSC